MISAFASTRARWFTPGVAAAATVFACQWHFRDTEQVERLLFAGEFARRRRKAQARDDGCGGGAIRRDRGAVTIDGAHFDLHTLTPPMLDAENIAGFVPCVRPSRDACVRLDVEEVDIIARVPASGGGSGKSTRRVIFHNYGHGGAGWSLGPGCVDHVLRAFDAKRVPRDEPIAVVGAGLIGLFTARGLRDRGYRDVTIITEGCPGDGDLTSNKAAGLIGVYALPGAERDERLTRAAVDTMDFFLRVHRGAIAGFAADCVRRLPRYVGTAELGADCDVFVRNGQMAKPREVVIRFDAEPRARDPVESSSGVNRDGPLRKVFVYDDAVFLDVVRLMGLLETMLLAPPAASSSSSPCRLEHRRVESLTDAADIPESTRYVFNCSGAGAKELVGDATVRRNGGHLVQLREMRPGSDAYMLDFESPDASGGSSSGRGGSDRTKSALYYVPKGGGLLGGSVVSDMDEHEMFDPREFDRIVDDARSLFYGDRSFERS